MRGSNIYGRYSPTYGTLKLQVEDTLASPRYLLLCSDLICFWLSQVRCVIIAGNAEEKTSKDKMTAQDSIGDTLITC
jgi:hypothetical protein